MRQNAVECRDQPTAPQARCRISASVRAKSLFPRLPPSRQIQVSTQLAIAGCSNAQQAHTAAETYAKNPQPLLHSLGWLASCSNWSLGHSWLIAWQNKSSQVSADMTKLLPLATRNPCGSSARLYAVAQSLLRRLQRNLGCRSREGMQRSCHFRLPSHATSALQPITDSK